MPTQMGFIRYRAKKVSTATTLTHYSPQVDHNERWYIAMLAFSCSTTANADIIVSIETHGYDHVIGSQINMIEAEWYFIRPQLWLEGGERLKFAWDGIVDTEVCEVHITGHAQYVNPD
jgi:hypothetical protein